MPVGDAFVLELVGDLALLFMSFGVGLDPRQKQVFGPALAPILVGLVLGVISVGTAFTRRGYNGVSANPARCLGVFVGSRFPSYHWVSAIVLLDIHCRLTEPHQIHWVGDIAAGMVHGAVYFLVPPWNYQKLARADNFVSRQSSA